MSIFYPLSAHYSAGTLLFFVEKLLPERKIGRCLFSECQLALPFLRSRYTRITSCKSKRPEFSKKKSQKEFEMIKQQTLQVEGEVSAYFLSSVQLIFVTFKQASTLSPICFQAECVSISSCLLASRKEELFRDKSRVAFRPAPIYEKCK